MLGKAGQALRSVSLLGLWMGSFLLGVLGIGMASGRSGSSVSCSLIKLLHTYT